MLVLGVFTSVSTLTDVNGGASKVRLSGVPIGLIIAIVLLGPGPAAVLGATTMLVSWWRTRCALDIVVNNVVTFAWFPLVAGLFFHSAVHGHRARPDEVGYYMLVFLTFVVALTVNFIGIFTYHCYLDGSSLAHKQHAWW